MIRVKITNKFPEWPLLRQTPGSKGIWGEYQFFVNDDTIDCDYWVVYDSLSKIEVARCPKQNVILLTGEPPTVCSYNQNYLLQFATVLSCHENLPAKNLICTQTGLPWMVGAHYLSDQKKWSDKFDKGYDELVAIQQIDKPKLLSVIASDKAFSPGHQQRLEFVRRLKEHFGDELDVFGRGIRDFEDKWEVVAPYKYHVAIENSSFKHYWTEKLTDTFLAGSFPIYYGCSNIGEYFDEGSLLSIDINFPEQAIEIIGKAIKANLFEESVSVRARARLQVLNNYNLFPLLAKICEPNNAKSQTIKLKPAAQCVPLWLRTKSSIKRRLSDLQGLK